MGYDIVEDIKKTKANISLFELCNLPQQRKNILIHNLVAPRKTFNPIKKLMKQGLEGNPNLKLFRFYYLLIFLIIMCIIVWWILGLHLMSCHS